MLTVKLHPLNDSHKQSESLFSIFSLCPALIIYYLPLTDEHLPNGGCDGRGADVRHLHLRVDGLDDAHRGQLFVYFQLFVYSQLFVYFTLKYGFTNST